MEHAKGAVGHSDADVVIHAICDALLGAAALGDIGAHFPPGDPKFKGVSSLSLLEEVKGMLVKAGWKVVNVDVIMVAEQPKLRGHVDAMRANLARAMGVAADQVSIKASTSEELGFVGREEGMVAWAVELIDKK